jgi:hypothetical protein
MQIVQDRAYFVTLADKARALAQIATDPGIRNIHLRRAKRYEILARDDIPLPFITAG